jgi:hypothetical protein
MNNNLNAIIREEIQNFVVNILKSPLNIYHGADINNLKNFMANPRILSPEEKIKLPSNTGGYNVGLSTSTNIDKAKKYSKYGFGHSKVLHLQLISGAKIIQIDTKGDSIDDIFTGDDLENYQKQGIDAIIELDDSAENEARVLNFQHLKIIGVI